MRHDKNTTELARKRFDELVEKQRTEGLNELEVSVKAILMYEFQFEPKPEVRKYNDFSGY